MRFPSSLALFFTLDGARCQGTPGPVPRRVDLENVTYTASIRRGPPLCIAESSVTYTRFESSNPAFAMLFATRGPQTLTPVLDRFALGWLSAGLMTCPPNPIPVGVVTRCPS